MRRASRTGVGAVAVAVALATLALGAGDAAARRWRGGAWLHYEASYVHRLEDDAAPGGDGDAAGQGLGLAGLRLRGFASRGFALGYLVGVDLHAGATNPGGFAYQVDLYLAGAGARLGDAGMAGLGAGIGASGAIGTLDDGVALPVEAFLELGVGPRLRVLARARAVWLGAAPGRRHGAPTFGWADEVDATLGLRVGRRYRQFGFPSGNGYFAGVAYREALGARFVGAVVGYSVDVGGS